LIGVHHYRARHMRRHRVVKQARVAGDLHGHFVGRRSFLTNGARSSNSQYLKYVRSFSN
jgi:hypothetical protein